MKKQTIAIALSVTLSGCAAVASVSAYINTFVSNYCAQDELGRKLLRENFKVILEPNQIFIKCHGDVININPVSVTF